MTKAGVEIPGLLKGVALSAGYLDVGKAVTLTVGSSSTLPREVLEFLDRLGGIRRIGLASETGHEAWVERVRRERPGGWR